MKNEKVTMSSVEWLQAIELERDLTLADWNKAKARHKEEIKNAYTNGFISSKGSNRIADEIFYNENYGGNDEQQ
ncbi:MAG: hypothetical protein ACK55Z_27175 [bacterium]|jgi:hypothetical protein